MKQINFENIPDSTFFDQAYWVLPAKLMAGCYPGAENRQEAHQNLSGLLHCGIRHVVNLMQSDECNRFGRPFLPYESPMASIADSMGHTATFDRIPIKDRGTPSRIDMGHIIDRIDQCLENGKPVYVHCLGGIGRTGMVVGCYLARHGYATDQDVLKLIRKLRKGTPTHQFASPETARQIEMVRSWVESE